MRSGLKQFAPLPYVWTARLGLAILAVLTWELSVGAFPERFDPMLYGQPTRIATEFKSYVASGFLFTDTRATVIASAAGLALGLISGLMIGVGFGYNEFLYRVFEPYLIALNSLPRPALAPLFLLWFGLGVVSKALLSLSLVFFVVFFNTYSGMRQIDRGWFDLARVFGASRRDEFTYILFPSVMSWVFASFRTSVSFSLIGVVVGEFIGASRGLGYRILWASNTLNINLALGILIWLGFLASVTVMAAGSVERYLLRWQMDTM